MNRRCEIQQGTVSNKMLCQNLSSEIRTQLPHSRILSFSGLKEWQLQIMKDVSFKKDENDQQTQEIIRIILSSKTGA